MSYSRWYPAHQQHRAPQRMRPRRHPFEPRSCSRSPSTRSHQKPVPWREGWTPSHAHQPRRSSHQSMRTRGRGGLPTAYHPFPRSKKSQWRRSNEFGANCSQNYTHPKRTAPQARWEVAPAAAEKAAAGKAKAVVATAVAGKAMAAAVMAAVVVQAVEGQPPKQSRIGPRSGKRSRSNCQNYSTPQYEEYYSSK